MWVNILITVQHHIPLLLHSAVISMWVSLQAICGCTSVCVCTCPSSSVCGCVCHINMKGLCAVIQSATDVMKIHIWKHEIKLQLWMEAKSANVQQSKFNFKSVSCKLQIPPALKTTCSNFFPLVPSKEHCMEKLLDARTVSIHIITCKNRFFLAILGKLKLSVSTTMTLSPYECDMLSTGSFKHSVVKIFASSSAAWFQINCNKFIIICFFKVCFALHQLLRKIWFQNWMFHCSHTQVENFVCCFI